MIINTFKKERDEEYNKFRKDKLSAAKASYELSETIEKERNDVNKKQEKLTELKKEIDLYNKKIKTQIEGLEDFKTTKIQIDRIGSDGKKEYEIKKELEVQLKEYLRGILESWVKFKVTSINIEFE